MSSRTALRLLIAYLAVYTIVLTFPGVLPFNRREPMVLGMPFVMIWYAFWVGLGALVLHQLERAKTREEDAAQQTSDRYRAR